MCVQEATFYIYLTNGDRQVHNRKIFQTGVRWQSSGIALCLCLAITRIGLLLSASTTYLVYQARPSLTLKRSERIIADVISMHEMLTNQILLFHSETVATPWLQYVRLLLVQF